MMRDPYYCTQCRCLHDKSSLAPLVYFDAWGDCLSADNWLQMHDEEDYDSIIGTGWVQSVIEEDLPSHNYIKTIHRCGHMTLSVSGIVLEWCHDCRERRSYERYDYQGLS